MKQEYAKYTAPEFWEQTWQEVSRHNPLGAAYRNPKIWDKMASGYNKSETDLQERQAREKALIQKLSDLGMIGEGKTVLDLGCGPGNFALAFAEHGSEVVALDVSEKMLEELQKRMPGHLSNRIKPIQADWKMLDLRQHGYEKAFDLVFARMTPACNALDQFEKILSASRNWCYYASWVGHRKDQPLDEVWQTVTGQPRNRANNQFQIILNLLITRQMYPELWFHKVHWQKHEKPNDVVQHISTLISTVKGQAETELIPEISMALEPFLKDGKVQETKTGMIAEMLWQMNT